MSRLSRLAGKPEDVTIAGEVFTIHPFCVSDMGSIRGIEENPEKMVDIVKKTIKASVPDATEEEINAVGMKHFNEFSLAILKVNGINPEEYGIDTKPTE